MRKNSTSTPKLLNNQFLKKNGENENMRETVKKKKIEDIMDPKKQKLEDLKNFEMKLENKQEYIKELIVNTNPNEKGSNKDMNAKDFFKDNAVTNDGLTFETRVPKSESKGVFDFEMNMDDLKNEDIFFSNKAPKLSNSVIFIYIL